MFNADQKKKKKNFEKRKKKRQEVAEIHKAVKQQKMLT